MTRPGRRLLSSSPSAWRRSTPDCAGEPLEPEVEHIVRRRERQPRPADTGGTEALARRDDNAVLGEQALVSHAFGQAHPDVERPLARRREIAGHGEDAVSSLLIQPYTRRHGILRPGQRGDPRLLNR